MGIWCGQLGGTVSRRRCPLKLRLSGCPRGHHTTRKENFDLAHGTWVMYFRRGKVTRGAIGAPSKSGLWLGLARVIMTEAIQQWSGSVHSTTGQIGVVWLSHGNKLIRCLPTQLRRCSEREFSIAFSERSCANLDADERDRNDECSVSWTIRRLVDRFAN